MEQIRIDDNQKIDKVIVTCVMDLYTSLAETKGIDGMQNDFTDLFEILLKINKKLCNKPDTTTKIEASEYYHNSVNYYKDDEDDEDDETEDDHGIQFVDQK